MTQNRRTVLLGIGAAGLGGGAVFGSGAFTQSQADRESALIVSNDDEALLAMEPGDGTGSSVEQVERQGNNEQIELEFGELHGAGVNVDGVTLFRDVLEVTNNGDEDILLLAAGPDDDDSRRARARVLANDESLTDFVDGNENDPFDYGNEVSDISKGDDFNFSPLDPPSRSIEEVNSDAGFRFALNDTGDPYDTGPVTVGTGESVSLSFEFETAQGTRSQEEPNEFEFAPGLFRLKAFSTELFDDDDLDDEFEDDDILSE